jgi:hypothetical protein
MYQSGIGTAIDYPLAVRWYRIGAERRDGMSMRNLGVMYANGQGVPRDYMQAYMWFALAADSIEDVDQQKEAVRYLRIIVGSLSAEQLVQAQAMATRCSQLEFKTCD